MDTNERNQQPVSQQERQRRRPEGAARTKSSPSGQARKADPRKRTAAGQKRPSAAAKKKRPAQRPGRSSNDANYHPYRAAEQRKKAARATARKKFFSAENPAVSFFQSFGKKTSGRRRSSSSGQKNTPAVIYTQPLPFNRNRLLIQLVTVIAVVVALILGLSVFFKVENITVSGAGVYSPSAVQEASGILKGDNLLTFGRAKASGKITAKLPYVKSVRIGIKLPDTVNIEIEEEDVVYAIRSEEGIWWLINSEGKVVEMTTGGNAASYTKVIGVTLTDPMVGEAGTATEEIPTETDEAGEYIPLTVTGEQRLRVALEILKQLEANDIVGEAASVDVSFLENIVLWYGTRYQVILGDSSNLEYKIRCMTQVISQMNDYQTGVLDISFTTREKDIVYTPFE